MARVLVVDDSDKIRSFFQQVVLLLSHECFLAENGQKGLELANKIKPDLIISDMIMPIMGGRDFIIQLRKIGEFQKTPIIIISAYVTVKEVMDLLNLGGTYFLKKPVDVEELGEIIQRSLKIK